MSQAAHPKSIDTAENIGLYPFPAWPLSCDIIIVNLIFIDFRNL